MEVYLLVFAIHHYFFAFFFSFVWDLELDNDLNRTEQNGMKVRGYIASCFDYSFCAFYFLRFRFVIVVLLFCVLCFTPTFSFVFFCFFFVLISVGGPLV